jgi:hypothetical protein
MGQFTSSEKLLFWVSCGSALLAIIVGYLFPNTGTAILKDFMVFGSGAGIAYILARSGARATTSERVRSLCNRLVQRLGLTASQTRNTSSLILREVQNQASTEVLAFLLDSVAEQAEVSIGDLEEMAGVKIVLDDLVSDALHNIKTAAEDLPETSSEVKEKILASVKEVAAAATPPTGTMSPTGFSCPQCGKSLSAVLREAAGSTAHSRCPECSAQVIVHRTRDGSVFAKIYASALRGAGAAQSLTAKQVGSILCPSCKRSIFVNMRAGGRDPIIRNCFYCNERIYIDGATGAVVRSEHPEPLVAIYKMDGLNAVLTCPSCSNILRISNNPEHKILKVSCPKCTYLIHATVYQEIGSGPEAEIAAQNHDAPHSTVGGTAETFPNKKK